MKLVQMLTGVLLSISLLSCTPSGTVEETPQGVGSATSATTTGGSESQATEDGSTSGKGSSTSARTSDQAAENSSERTKPVEEWVVVELDDSESSAREVYQNASQDEDHSAAVDDEIWRQLDLAGEYYSMGLVANQGGSWDEAQYYFERSLKLMGGLDIESQSTADSASAEWRRYNGLLENIIAAYNITLLSLGRLPADISPSAMIERFGDIENFKMDTAEAPAVLNTVVTYDMPIKFNDRVKASIKYFQTDARDAFLRYYSRSTKYIPMMREIIRSYGLPEDLVYLPLVESGYNARAYSWAKASGLWQFIASTGRMFNLKRSWWYDERRDPVKATHAACKYLKSLYKEFGDWELALAAYNAGPGRVRRTMKKAKTSDYWKLRRLKRETRNYVPLYMAATIICKNPREYGFDPDEVTFEMPLVFETVTIDKCLELATVAQAVGATQKEIANLNPELLRKHTPPKAKKYKLKIPLGSKRLFAAAYPAMESPQETSWVRHRIRKGESVSTIAARYGVSQYAIRDANNLRTSRIYAGKTIIVPVPLDGAPSARGKTRKRTAENGVYVVRGGDSIYDIARAFGISMSSLKNLNNVGSRSRIYVGQKLRIPGMRSSSKATYAKTTPKKKSNARSNATISESSADYITHKVRRGQNLSVIARRYGVTVSQLRRWNSLGGSTMIHPGQRLRVKYTGDDTGKSSSAYTVRRGDSLWKIARKLGLTVSKLRAWNNISSRGKIKPGQKLRVSPLSAALSPASISGVVWHTVRRGENLTTIARIYDTTVERLKKDNKIRDPRKMRAGDRLKVVGY